MALEIEVLLAQTCVGDVGFFAQRMQRAKCVSKSLADEVQA